MINLISFNYKNNFFFGLLLFWIFVFSHPALALEPHELLVIANKKNGDSIELAHFYMQKRNIPIKNLIIINTTDKESCSRESYETEIKNPVRYYFTQHPVESRAIRCVVLMYGMPLKILPAEGQDDYQKTDRASVDSEIALVRMLDYSLEGWILNPFFFRYQKRNELTISKDDILMVSRIDGPTLDIAKRIITDSIDVEKTGLSGNAYFDARWSFPDIRPLEGHAAYDYAIHRSAQVLGQTNMMMVVIDDKESLFKQGSNLDAALYCGWYSLGKYVDAFKWQKGSVGYHIASSECTTLKKPNSQVWCKMMLEKGIAATIGPVFEPYAEAFPVPDIFFGFLVDGYLSLAECYILSTRFLSWQMVLIGDPLYKPFYRRRNSP
jgi:uncharacterized protein (TIGR03790 family)